VPDEPSTHLQLILLDSNQYITIPFDTKFVIPGATKISLQRSEATFYITSKYMAWENPLLNKCSMGVGWLIFSRHKPRPFTIVS
jgi:hypothetical protein